VNQEYRQYLPDLDLALERGTNRVPSDGRWYLLKGDEIVGRFRKKADAQFAWRDELQRRGWKPPTASVDPKTALKREAQERWARNRAG
jgi:hypothetical protein